MNQTFFKLSDDFSKLPPTQPCEGSSGLKESNWTENTDFF